MTKVTVKQPEPPAAEVPIEVMADAVVAISESIKKMRAGPLNERALLLLIQHAIPMSGRPTAKQIKAVLDAAESLKTLYLKR